MLNKFFQKPARYISKNENDIAISGITGNIKTKNLQKEVLYQYIFYSL